MKIFKNWKVILAVMLVFGAGLLTGAMLSYQHFKRGFEHFFTVEGWTSETMKWYQKEIKLTPEQEPKIRKILEETGQQFGNTFSTAVRISGTNLVSSWQRINEVLTPEQRALHQRKCNEFRDVLNKNLKIELPQDPK